MLHMASAATRTNWQTSFYCACKTANLNRNTQNKCLKLIPVSVLVSEYLTVTYIIEVTWINDKCMHLLNVLFQWSLIGSTACSFGSMASNKYCQRQTQITLNNSGKASIKTPKQIWMSLYNTYNLLIATNITFWLIVSSLLCQCFA